MIISKQNLGDFFFVAANLFLFLYLVLGGFLFLGVYYLTIIFGAIFFGRLNLVILCGILINVCCMLFFGFLSVNFEFDKLLLYILGFLSSFSYALYLVSLNNKVFLSKFVYLLFASYVLYFVVRNGFSNIELFNEIFFGSSRNLVSGVLNLLLVNVMVSSYFDNKKLNLTYYILNIILCFILFGRTGIFISFFLFVLGLYFSGRNKFLIGFISVVSTLIYSFQEKLFLFLDENTNFSQGLSSPREIIKDEYISSVQTSSDFFWGSNVYNCCSYLATLEYNLHNSFIFMHSRFGFYVFIFNFIIFIFLALRAKWFFIFIYFVVVFRYFYDQVGLFSILDLTLFYILIAAYFYQVDKRNFVL